MLVVAGLTGENQAKGIFAALFGLLIGCIGMDSISGVSRFTFGQLWLEDGLEDVYKRQGQMTPIVALETVNIMTMVSMCRAGYGVIICPSVFVEENSPVLGGEGKRCV